MLISEMMTINVATVDESATLSKAFQVLHDGRHKVLPVVRSGKLVGLLSEKLLAEVKPSKATALSVYELNYLLSRMFVKEVMLKYEDVYYTHPNALVEEAALAMYHFDIGSLPVVTDDNTLVGIITQTDIFKAFIKLMGVDHKSTRLAIDVPDDPGTVATIAKIIADTGINIGSICNYKKGNNRQEIVLKIASSDKLKIDNVLATLKNAGFNISEVRVFE